MLQTQRRKRKGRKTKEKVEVPIDRQEPVQSSTIHWKYLDEPQRAALLNCAHRLAAANPFETVRKAQELPFYPEDAALECRKAIGHPEPHMALLPFSKRGPPAPSPRCNFCHKMLHHLTSECRHLAAIECGLCKELGHRANFCTKIARPEVDQCCQLVAEHFSSFLWHRAFRRAVAVYDFELFCQVLDACYYGPGVQHCFFVTRMRNWGYRDMFFQHLLPRLMRITLQEFTDALVATKTFDMKRRSDMRYIVVDCLSHGAKIPAALAQRWTNLVNILRKVLSRKLVSIASHLLLPPLRSLVAEYAISKADFQK